MASNRALQVTAAIIRRQGEVLIARRPADDHLGGLWEFPGGKVEEGESPEECLARELREELEVDSTVGQFITSSRHSYDTQEIELLAYAVELSPGDSTLNNHDEARWVPIRDLLNWDLAPADIPIANVLVRLGGVD